MYTLSRVVKDFIMISSSEPIIGEFFILLRKIFLIVRSYLFVVINIKKIMGALVTLEVRLKVPILTTF